MSLRKGIGFCQQSEPRFLNAVFIVFITDPISGGPVSQYPIEIWLSKKLCSLFACTENVSYLDKYSFYMLKWVRKFAGTGSLYTDKSRMKKA